MSEKPQAPQLRVQPPAASITPEDPMEVVFRKATIQLELHLRSLIPPRPDGSDANVLKFPAQKSPELK